MAKPTSIDTFRNAFREIRRGESLKPVYYIYGDESFFVELLQDEILKLIPHDQKDFNVDLLYGADTSPAKVLAIARSYPMMAERRIVIVRDFLKMESSAEGGDINDFVEYLRQPNPSTLLCLVDGKRPDRRTALGKALSAKSTHLTMYKFDAVPEYKLVDWVTDWTRHSHNRKIAPDAAQILSELIGQNLKLLSTEIEKVCTLVDSGEMIQIDHIKKITGNYRDYTVYELKKAVLNRNLYQALGITEQMLHKSNYNAGEVIKTVGFFYSVFSNIWQICRLIERGLNKKQVQDALGVNSSYIFNIQWQEASRFRLAEMPRIFEALLDADRAAKGYSTLDTSSIFLLLIKRIIG